MFRVQKLVRLWVAVRDGPNQNEKKNDRYTACAVSFWRAPRNTATGVSDLFHLDPTQGMPFFSLCEPVTCVAPPPHSMFSGCTRREHGHLALRAPEWLSLERPYGCVRGGVREPGDLEVGTRGRGLWLVRFPPPSFSAFVSSVFLRR